MKMCCKINLLRSRPNSNADEVFQKLRGGWFISRSSSQSFRGDISKSCRGWKQWHTYSTRGITRNIDIYQIKFMLRVIKITFTLFFFIKKSNRKIYNID